MCSGTPLYLMRWCWVSFHMFTSHMNRYLMKCFKIIFSLCLKRAMTCVSSYWVGISPLTFQLLPQPTLVLCLLKPWRYSFLLEFSTLHAPRDWGVPTGKALCHLPSSERWFHSNFCLVWLLSCAFSTCFSNFV